VEFSELPACNCDSICHTFKGLLVFWTGLARKKTFNFLICMLQIHSLFIVIIGFSFLVVISSEIY